MARIRTIKPEFFSSEDITNLTPLSRLFYVSLWCESDREGRFEYRPGTLKNRYFPADQDIEIESMACELENRGLVIFYASNDRIYGCIPGFKKHQVINNREGNSILPDPENCKIFTLSATRDDACVTRESGRKEGRKGKEGKEEATRQDEPDPLPARAEKSEKHKYGEGKNVLLTDDELSRLKIEFPDQCAQGIEFLSDYKIRKRYVSHDDNRTLRKWVFKALAEESRKGNFGADHAYTF